MAPQTPSKRQQVKQALLASPPPLVDETALAALRREFPLIPLRDIRAAIRESGLPMTPLVEGVRQENLAELDRTLCALEREYSAGGHERRREIRELVKLAKTHAGWTARTQSEKAEMVVWMRTWLENPSLFPSWVELRRRRLAAAAG